MRTGRRAALARRTDAQPGGARTCSRRLLWWSAAALAMRTVFESVVVAYYLWPTLAVALITASRSWPRLVAASLAAAVLTLVSQVSGRGPWIWWASMVAGLGLTVFLARVPLRSSGVPQHAVNTRDHGKDRRSIMKQRVNLPRWARWAVPAGVLVVAGGVAGGIGDPRGPGGAAAAVAHTGATARRAGRGRPRRRR